MEARLRILMRTLRRHLLEERGLPQAWVHLTGDWKRGVTDPDHDED